MQKPFFEIEQPSGKPLVPSVDGAAVDALRKRTYQSYEGFLRAKLEELERTRAQRWSRDYSNHTVYITSIAPQRALLKEMLGFWVEPSDRPPLRPGPVETIFTDETFVARRFTLEVLPGLESYAVTLTPSKPNGAGLLIQHGYGGTPELAIGLTPSANAPDYSYRSMGIRAVRRGYFVVAVHHPSGYGQDGDTISWPLPGFPNFPTTYGKNRLHRMAVMAGGTLFGLDMMASSRGVDLLRVAEGVSPERLGMYGLSQGGQSALYLPALDTRLRASVSAAWFNRRLNKMIGPHRAAPYLNTTEEDKFFTKILSHFSDSDVASLIAPRAFADEAGQHDGSVDIEGAEEEFRKVREHYTRLGIPERCAFIPHAEGHVPATRRAFEFLDEHLKGTP